MTSFASLVFVLTCEGIPVVRDISRMNSLWKLPGGTFQEGETPEECGARELFEETGIRVCPATLQELRIEDRGNHILYAFWVDIRNQPVPELRTGDEGEKNKYVPLKEILHIREFLVDHKRIIEEFVRGLVRLA